MKLEQSVTLDFVTSDPTTGAAADATGTPTAAVYEDATDNALGSVTVAKRTGLTGHYRATFAAAEADGYEAGKCYNVVAAATVAGVAGKGIIGTFVVEAKHMADLNDLSFSDVTHAVPTASAIATYVWVTNATGAAVATCLSGITYLKNWLGALAGKAADAVTLDEINLTEAGATYNNRTDALEALRDRGDSEWVTATGFETAGAAAAAVGTLNDLSASDVTGAVPTADAIADAVWDEASTGHTDSGKAGAAIWTTIPGIAGILSGITSLAAWLRGLARKSAMDATAKTELNTGGGTYDEVSDSLEAEAEAISALGAGSGAAAITLTVKASGVAVQGVAVTLQATGGNNIVNTNASGQAVFNRDDGSWTYAIEDTNGYTGATGTVVVASGAVTSPAGGILTITPIALPTPASADCYAIWDTETDEKDATFGASAMTVTVANLSSGGRVDATHDRFRSIMRRSATTDSNGQWSIDIPKAAFTAGALLSLEKSWTDSDSVAQKETWVATLVAPASGVTVCWSDLSPTQV